MSAVADTNVEALEAWDGVLFDRFVQYRHLVVDGLAPHGDAAFKRHPPAPGDRVLDVGCGFGDSSAHLAQLVGSEGTVLGTDFAPRFIESAAAEFAAPNVRFEVADLQLRPFEETFDYVYSRFGTMFFASPVAALRNVAATMQPGGRFVSVVWRRKLDNPWLHVAEEVVDAMVEEPEESDEPRCGPGPFSMANADTLSDILVGSGFADVAFERCDLPYRIGRDLEEAVAYNLALGPAAEVIRLAGADAEAMRPQVEQALHDALEPYATADGVILSSSTWIVTAVRAG